LTGCQAETSGPKGQTLHAALQHPRLQE